MSDHSSHDHADHGHAHDDHGHAAHGHDEHGHGGHDDHGGHGGHGDHHEEHWGDYNSQPLPPSNLPTVSPLLLVAFGTALTFLLCMVIASSFMLAQAREHHPAPSHGEKAEATGEGHE